MRARSERMGMMNSIQRQFINLLSYAIKKQSVESVNLRGNDWNQLIEEAEAHKVSGLVYTALKRNIESFDIESSTLVKWKKDIIFGSLNQSEHIKKVAQLLNSFNEAQIPVIVLKGVVLRYLYPAPDLRTMNDVDVLVHEEDLRKIESLLTSLGYYKYQEEGEKHDVYIKSGYPMVEVHWMLSHERTFKGCVEYEKSIWNRVREVEVEGVRSLTLGYNDFLLHLMIHMASHAASHGFGVRFLTDIVLMIEQEGPYIDWAQFKKDIRQCEIETFTGIMLRCCEDLFDFKIPMELEEIADVNLKYLDALETEILDCGVHGLREKGNLIVKEMAYNREERQLFKRFLKFIFPPIDSMSERYDYAKKRRYLTLVAWIHHFFAGVFHSDYKLGEKVRFFFFGMNSMKQRSDLIRWLDLE